MKNGREQLKELIDDLTGLYEDENREITNITHDIYSSTCTPCKDYGDNLFENIVIVSERKR